MALRAHFCIDEETVKQTESFRQRAVIWGRRTREEEQRRIAVALRHVAKDLVVGPVFLDDVHHVLERGIGRLFCGAAPVVEPGNHV